MKSDESSINVRKVLGQAILATLLTGLVAKGLGKVSKKDKPKTGSNIPQQVAQVAQVVSNIGTGATQTLKDGISAVMKGIEEVKTGVADEPKVRELFEGFRKFGSDVAGLQEIVNKIKEMNTSQNRAKLMTLLVHAMDVETTMATALQRFFEEGAVQISNVESQTADKQAQIDVLNAQISSLNSTKQQQQQLLEESRISLRKLEDELKQYQLRLNETNSELTEKEIEIQTLGQDVKQKNSELDKLKNEAEQQSSKFKMDLLLLEQELNGKKDTVQRIENELKSNRQSSSTLSKAQEDLRTKLEQSEQQLQADIDRLQKVLDKKEKLFESQVKRSHEKITELQNEINKLTDDKRHVEEELTDQKALLKSQKDENIRLKSEIVREKSRIEKTDEEIKGIQTKLQEAEKRTTELKIELDFKTKELMTKVKEIAETKKNFDDVKGELENERRKADINALELAKLPTLEKEKKELLDKMTAIDKQNRLLTDQEKALKLILELHSFDPEAMQQDSPQAIIDAVREKVNAIKALEERIKVRDEDVSTLHTSLINTLTKAKSKQLDVEDFSTYPVELQKKTREVFEYIETLQRQIAELQGGRRSRQRPIQDRPSVGAPMLQIEGQSLLAIEDAPMSHIDDGRKRARRSDDGAA